VARPLARIGARRIRHVAAEVYARCERPDHCSRRTDGYSRRVRARAQREVSSSRWLFVGRSLGPANRAPIAAPRRGHQAAVTTVVKMKPRITHSPWVSSNIPSRRITHLEPPLASRCAPTGSTLLATSMAHHRYDCVVGLGSNLGERRATLSAAVQACASLGRVGGVSALYATAPVGGPRQPEYLNAALLLGTDLDPPQLLERLRQLEMAAGRERGECWGPRTLDLDILWIRGQIWRGPTLSVPHPRLTERAFALVPLLDVVPDAADPSTGVPYGQLLATLGRTGVRKVALPTEWARDDA